MRKQQSDRLHGGSAVQSPRVEEAEVCCFLTLGPQVMVGKAIYQPGALSPYL